MVAYLKYLWRSTNAHGVHSPFVYELVTRALRCKKRHSLHPAADQLPFFKHMPSKYQRALNNSLHHLFGADALRTAALTGLTKKEYPDLAFIDLTVAAEIPNPDRYLTLLQNDTPLVVRKEGDHPFWDTLTQHPDLHLTIDLFGLGMAWKRKQQASENFIIRL